jgi:hypothetical protein
MPPHGYQLRVVVQGISPLIWRRLLIRSDMSLATLHTMLQIVFGWSDIHLHSFRIHGQEYGSTRPGSSSFVDPRQVPPPALRLHRGECFRYVYHFIDHWECEIRLEAILLQASHRHYPVCLGANAPPRNSYRMDCPSTKRSLHARFGNMSSRPQTYDQKPKRRPFEVLTSQGHQPNQQTTFLSDGGDTIRDVQLYLNPHTEHLLDWLHVAIRLTILQQTARGLPDKIRDGEEEYPLRDPIVRELERLK